MARTTTNIYVSSHLLQHTLVSQGPSFRCGICRRDVENVDPTCWEIRESPVEISITHEEDGAPVKVPGVLSVTRHGRMIISR